MTSSTLATFALYLHFLAVIVLAGSQTHNLLLVLGYWRGRYRITLEKRYVPIAFWAYVAVVVFGMIVYPAFRVEVRAAYFDPSLPWATGLFEIKEHVVGVGLGLFAAYVGLSRSLDPKTDRQGLKLYTALALLLYLISWYALTAGFYLTTLQSV
ncbi:MAG: hypothetical protein RhofKO_40140 [Rhodothermales bacterium]